MKRVKRKKIFLGRIVGMNKNIGYYCKVNKRYFIIFVILVEIVISSGSEKSYLCVY